MTSPEREACFPEIDLAFNGGKFTPAAGNQSYFLAADCTKRMRCSSPVPAKKVVALVFRMDETAGEEVTPIWCYDMCSAPVAQLDRASDFESAGRPFESGRARQNFQF